jgi:hypothetical protein
MVQRTMSSNRQIDTHASHSTGYPITGKGGYAMASASRIDELAEKHSDLEAAIEEELTHPSADSLRISEMKKEKLRIKEEITRLEHPEEARA